MIFWKRLRLHGLQQKGVQMFNKEHLDKIDRNYFNVIIADDRNVTLQSRNTGHYWYLHCTGYPTEGTCIIFHKHRFNHPYHQHGRARTLHQAVKNIKGHDEWQMNGKHR